MERLKNSGDVTYLKKRNDELSSQLRETRREETALKNRLKIAEEKIKELSCELRELRASVDFGLPPAGLDRSARTKSGPSTSSAMVTRAPIPSGNTTRPLTPKKNKSSRGKTNERTTSMMESLQDCEGQLNIMYEDRMSRFEELLAQMRSDLYGLMEALSEKVRKTTSAVDPPKRGVPRIISDVQLVPPRTTSNRDSTNLDWADDASDLEPWTEVTAHRKKKSVRLEVPADNETEPAPVIVDKSNINTRLRPQSVGSVRRRPPKNAAVAIKISSDGPSYAEIIKCAREGVDLKQLGIQNPRMRRAANGGVLIEILGPEGTVKADSLATRLREVIGGDATVSRPIVKADIRISGFDDSVIKDELIAIVTDVGGCLASDVRVGISRQMKNGSNMTWVQCPLAAASKLARKSKLNWLVGSIL